MTDCLPEAPYPPTTRAKGWRLEIDHERIRQSDTWALAGPEVRPWLLMLWMVAWEQMPCGSLPSEDGLVAARIGMAPKMFAKHREVLMRGWWLAADGRLYHAVIAEQVLTMLRVKQQEAERKAAYRVRMDEARRGNPPSVQQVSHGTDGGNDATGTGTSSSSSSKINTPPPPRKRGPAKWPEKPETEHGNTAPDADRTQAYLEAQRDVKSSPEAAQAGIAALTLLRAGRLTA